MNEQHWQRRVVAGTILFALSLVTGTVLTFTLALCALIGVSS